MRTHIAALAVIHLAAAAVYDRAITVFSPDGKLMQVSYAEEAVQQGALAVTASNGRDTIVMCLARGDNEGTSEPEGTDSGGIGGDSDDDVKASEGGASQMGRNGQAAAKDGMEKLSDKATKNKSDITKEGRAGHTRGMGTGAGVVDEVNNQDRKLCEVDEGIYFVFAGISADGRVLASKIRVECQSYRYSMGIPPSVEHIAKYVGGLQHRYTRTGGARPYGVSCLVAGFDGDSRRPTIFRSEPSGAFAEWTASAVGKASEKALAKLESVPDLSELDWRGTAEMAVRATVVGSARECDVLVLRRDIDSGAAAKLSTTAKEEVAQTDRNEAGEGQTQRRLGDGWRHRGRVWTKRFSGTVRRDGTVVLRAMEASTLGTGAGEEGSEDNVLVL